MSSHRLPDVLVKERGVVGLVATLVIVLICAFGVTRACALARDERMGRPPVAPDL